MRRILVLIAAVMGASIALSACAAKKPEVGEQFVVERVPENRPRWVTTPPADREGRLYFVGMKTHASSLENGGVDARQNGIQKVIEYIGGTGMVDYTRARVESGVVDEGQAGNYIEDGYRFLAESIAHGVYEEEIFYERVREWRLDGWHYFWNYNALLSISKDALERAAREAFEKQAAEARAKGNAQAEAFAKRLQEQLTEDATAPR